MSNEMKYINQVWGEPIAGERLSTNGHYTGERLGTPTQDALGADTTNTNAYYVEDVTIRYGTITQDAIEGSMPAVGVSVVHKLTKCTVDKGNGVYEKNGAVTFTYTADDGYELPTVVTVKVGGATKTGGTDYTWTVATGKLAFAANKLSADAEITVVATAE